MKELILAILISTGWVALSLDTIQYATGFPSGSAVRTFVCGVIR